MLQVQSIKRALHFVPANSCDISILASRSSGWLAFRFLPGRSTRHPPPVRSGPPSANGTEGCYKIRFYDLSEAGVKWLGVWTNESKTFEFETWKIDCTKRQE